MTLELSLKRSFPGFSLDCTFTVPKGLTVLFGYSGSGKSLTLNLISGLLSPDEGTITLGGKRLYDSRQGVSLPPGERRIGYLFQEHNLFPHMTCEENILFGAKRVGLSKGRRSLPPLLERFRIEKLAHAYPHEISGGQKKRVALAMALIGEPDLLLLDEPFSALDNPLRHRMRSCLTGIMSHLEIPVLLVTHDIVEALLIAENMVVLSHGRVAQEGSPRHLIENPLDENIALLLELPNVAALLKRSPP